ncbi:MAG: hypothetical protein QF898_05475 [SAR202 cluster bacterium]|jgi:hypothetical protein|nr:hypothetical protein [SAR202 cluster bacterium]MDP6714682.1 hypothetical protein [SAR202 cluster bacterium]
MSWDINAKHRVFQLYSEGRSETVIVKDVCEQFAPHNKTVRRCVAGLDLITLDSSGASDIQIKARQDRFKILGGTDRYLSDLERDWNAWNQRNLPSSASRSHIDRLVYFGVRFRDRIRAPLPHVVDLDNETNALPIWDGQSSQNWEEPPRDEDGLEKRVEDQWSGVGPYDARSHPLFPSFRKHLELHHCWRFLEEDLVSCWPRYRQAVRDAVCLASGEFREKLPGLSQQDADAMAWSIVMDQFHRAASPAGGIEFSYSPKRVQEGDGTVWRLVLGSWTVGASDDPNGLESLATAHREMVEEMASSPHVGPVADAFAELQSAVLEFMSSLPSDDDGMRKAILSGRCDSCY